MRFKREQYTSKIPVATIEETGEVIMIASDGISYWGYENVPSTVRRILNEGEEFRIINVADNPEMFKFFSDKGVFSQRTKKVTIITESAFYKVGMTANTQEAKEFREWIIEEIISPLKTNDKKTSPAFHILENIGTIPKI